MVGPFYPVVVRQLGDDEGGGYVAQVLDLVGCMSAGETPQQALGYVQIAMIEWLKEARRLGRDIPEPNSIVRRATNARSESSELVAKQREVLRAQAEIIAQQSVALERLRARLGEAEARSAASSIMATGQDRAVVAA